ncbi:MAG: mannose-1-phosphate guanylyltransferase/mannose-6-phosphate isomerase [Elusimicrobia bacterium]|nr:mannose-1-phosphate guanylyltransferase/mannose-6-phosphate isomerase [Elusimicrobiota bacterium]
MNQDRSLKVLILAGGMGKRLWPLSRKRWPKYMLRLGMEKSLIQQAYERINADKKDRYIVSSREAGFLIEKEISSADVYFVKENLISEPASRNTAPAIMLGINNFKDDDIVVVLPADHIIEGDFEETIYRAKEIALEGYIVTIGIKPRTPATGYGYIRKSEENILEGWKVESFREKPNLETAKKYVESGEYFWNAGIFVFKVSVMREEMKKYAPKIYESFEEIREGSSLDEVYRNMKGISIDYAVMEKTKKAAVVAFDGKWDDLGSWESVFNILTSKNGSYKSKNSLLIDSKNTMLYSEGGKLLAGVGLEDIILVDTDDAILVLKKGQGQKVQEVVEELEDSPLITYHSWDSRPWGGYRVLESSPGYKVKILEVSPGKRLSLQSHKKRDEVWTVMSGKCRATLGEETRDLRAGDTVKIPAGLIHRAENTGQTVLKILELASGDEIDEEDIVRYEDDYKRC